MTTRKAYLAAGCFWGSEDLLRTLNGVIGTRVGYTGGQTPDPVYDTVKTGTTGHAESIEITYDSDRISYAEILRQFFRMHDPTTRNRQGGDVGTQYRSAIFAQDNEESEIARQIIDEVNRSGRWKSPIVTTIEPLTTFYPAEEFHQNYLKKNPGGYTCHFWRN